jgi:hypothetical protein
MIVRLTFLWHKESGTSFSGFVVWSSDASLPVLNVRCLPFWWHLLLVGFTPPCCTTSILLCRKPNKLVSHSLKAANGTRSFHVTF